MVILRGDTEFRSKFERYSLATRNQYMRYTLAYVARESRKVGGNLRELAKLQVIKTQAEEYLRVMKTAKVREVCADILHVLKSRGFKRIRFANSSLGVALLEADGHVLRLCLYASVITCEVFTSTQYMLRAIDPEYALVIKGRGVKRLPRLR